MEPLIRIENLAKSFTLHTQGGTVIPVLDGIGFEVGPGECVGLIGPSGSGKSTLLRSLYANYKPDEGRVLVRHEGRWVDMAGSDPRLVLEVRKRTIGYVSQFLRVIPRVPAVDVVAEPLAAFGVELEEARERARRMLARLRIPEKLWGLAPATFSGGEQQRVNIARGFIADFPVLLLDEPTASLDPENRRSVLDIIHEARERGAALVGIFHDKPAREEVCGRFLELDTAREAA
jgi:alpha-D-ribose 1-methylphosphonate 5-triphosphate synthase subunit PhnL